MPSLADFDVFWAAYPSKVGRIAAEHEYIKARKRATAQKILDGVARYIDNKPAWKEWCNPKTFLREGRWMDEYDTPVVVVKEDCHHLPRCHNATWCKVVTAREKGEVA